MRIVIVTGIVTIHNYRTTFIDHVYTNEPISPNFHIKILQSAEETSA